LSLFGTHAISSFQRANQGAQLDDFQGALGLLSRFPDVQFVAALGLYRVVNNVGFIGA